MADLKLKKEARMNRDIYFIDIDDTLFETQCKVYILKNGKRIKELTPGEYNSYQKAKDEEIDFSDFANTKLFIDTAKPILPALNKLVNIINEIILKKSKDRVILLTSRPDFDSKSKILKYFSSFGIPVHQSRILEIVRCGNISDKLWTTAQKKQIIVGGYLLQNKYKKFTMWDDNIENLKRFYEIKLSSFKPVNFSIGHITHSVDEKGNNFNFKLIEVNDKNVEAYLEEATKIEKQKQKPIYTDIEGKPEFKMIIKKDDNKKEEK